MAELKVTQVRSAIGVKPKARGTLRALGLRRIGMSNVLPDRPEIQGMIRKVTHLVSVEEIEAPKKKAPAKKAAPKAAAKATAKAAAKPKAADAAEASTDATEEAP